MKTVVYVDGYNLYYGLLRKSKLKWLDLFTLFQDHVLNQDAQVDEIRYYTAPVLGRMCDDQASPERQRLYLQALRKTHPSKITIIQGKILASKPYQRLVNEIPEAPHLTMVQVYDFNEKKSDVNLASDLIAGAWTGAYEQAVICSNDTDLEAALATVRKHHPGLRLGVVAPVASEDHRKISKSLVANADWHKPLSKLHLQLAQLPDRIPHTSIRKPDYW